MFVNPILKTIDTIDRLEIGLESGERGIRLAIAASPLKIATAAAANRPGMPPGVFARIDTNFASTDSTTGIRNQIQKRRLQYRAATNDGKPTDDQKKQLEDVGNQLGGLVFDPATTSLGVEIVDKAPVLYVVCSDWSAWRTMPKEWKAA